MKKSGISNYFIVGFALFAVFFGAGNLVFPPAIGIQAGNAWGGAIVGMSISAILLPILTIIAVNNMGRDLEDLAKPVAPWFCSVYMILFVLFVGLVGVPRQGGVGIETGIFSLFPMLGGSKIALFIGLLCYFGLVFFLAGKPSRVVDIVGQMLTPFLLLILVFIAIMAFVKPIGAPASTGLEQPFVYAFVQGYQTGDVMVGIVIASIFIAAIRDRGYTERKDVNAMTLKAAVVAGVGLLVVYGGLLYLGATGTSYFAADMDQTALLSGLVHQLVGNAGSAALGLGVFLACLTTTIGVVSSIASTVVKLLHGKVNYRLIVGICCLVGVTIGTIGVSAIIAFSYPIFFLVYPVSIVLTLLGVCKKYVPNHGAWKGSVLMATIIGLYDMVGMMNALGVSNIHIGFIDAAYNAIPLASAGFAWLLPSIIGFAVGALIVKSKGGAAYPMLDEQGDAA